MEIRTLRNAVSRDMEACPLCEFRFSSFKACISICCGLWCARRADSAYSAGSRRDHRSRRASGRRRRATHFHVAYKDHHWRSPGIAACGRNSFGARRSPMVRPMQNHFALCTRFLVRLWNNYVAEGHVKFIDPVAPAETRAHPGGTLVYVVRTRASQKRASGDSNAVSVRMYPVPEPIANVEARVTEPAIELSWAAPTHTSGGDPLTAFSGYRIYRGELDPASAEAAAADFSKAKWKSPLTLLCAVGRKHLPRHSFRLWQDLRLHRQKRRARGWQRTRVFGFRPSDRFPARHFSSCRTAKSGGRCSLRRHAWFRARGPLVVHKS